MLLWLSWRELRWSPAHEKAHSPTEEGLCGQTEDGLRKYHPQPGFRYGMRGSLRNESRSRSLETWVLETRRVRNGGVEGGAVKDVKPAWNKYGDTFNFVEHGFDYTVMEVAENDWLSEIHWRVADESGLDTNTFPSQGEAQAWCEYHALAVECVYQKGRERCLDATEESRKK
jgi:hypothetical protein